MSNVERHRALATARYLSSCCLAGCRCSSFFCRRFHVDFWEARRNDRERKQQPLTIALARSPPHIRASWSRSRVTWNSPSRIENTRDRSIIWQNARLSRNLRTLRDDFYSIRFDGVSFPSARLSPNVQLPNSAIDLARASRKRRVSSRFRMKVRLSRRRWR